MQTEFMRVAVSGKVRVAAPIDSLSAGLGSGELLERAYIINRLH